MKGDEGGGEVCGSGPQTDKHLLQSPFSLLQVNFLDDDILLCLLGVLSFYDLRQYFWMDPLEE